VELDERKKKILQAIIKNYLETGEPVGSRTISKYTDLNLSSATIRNEMSDLEEMGYIFQPHTSAGRIPTDAGYRLYVDDMLASKEDLLSKKERDLSEMQDIMDKRVDRIEEVLKDMAKMLAVNTNYTSMISMPSGNRSKLKFAQLTQVDTNKILCTIVLEGNMVKNHIITVKNMVTPETLLKLNLLFNSNLCGLSLQEINFDMAAKIAEQEPEHVELVTEIINAIAGAIGEEDGIKIFTSGATNIFRYPELSDKTRASELISTFEEKELLTNLLSDDVADSENTTGIQVYIGDESPVSSMKDCSVVTATYEFEEGVYGKVGIIGPKRMDYEKVLEALNNVTGSLDKTFNNKKKKGGKD
jgi:heat-inducible transcriptional repressor